MKVMFFAVLILLAGCASAPLPESHQPPVLVGIDDSEGVHAEIWKRANGTRFLRFKLSDGKVKEMDIYSK